MQDKKKNTPAANYTDSQAEALSEIQEELEIRHERQRLFPRAALVGLCAGLVASLFRGVLAGADALRNSLLTWSQQFSFCGWIFPLLFSSVGAIVAVLLVKRYAPETSGSGIPHVVAVLQRLRTIQWHRVLPVKFISGALAIGGGLALGREGPTVQIGSAVGAAISKWLQVPPREQRTLIAAGAGAGLAAAFNAPLAGVMFVLEEIQHDFHPFVFGAVFLAAAIADIVVRLFFGNLPVLIVPNYPALPIATLPFFALLGLIAGLLGILFNRSLIGTLSVFDRFQGFSRLGLAAVIGAVIGIVGWFSPIAIGGGQSLALLILSGKFALAMLPILFVIRFILTICSYSTGASGGIFSPLLALGALFGLAQGQIAHHYLPSIVPEPGVFAVVGMAAYFAAIVRAPLTGVILIVEMTGDYQQMLPLLVSCFCAYAVAELMKDEPIYEALLERDLVHDGMQTSIHEPMVIDFEIEHGAPFAGQEIQALHLPPGCLIIRCVEGGHEFVPTARTRLESHMRFTALIAPEAAESLAILRRGVTRKKD